MVLFLVAMQIRGNLHTAQHWVQKQTSRTYKNLSRLRLVPMRLQSRIEWRPPESAPVETAHRRQPSVTEAYKLKENHANWKFTELLKISINFLQTVAAGMSLDVGWNEFIREILETFDWLGGPSSEATGFTLNCSLPDSGSRSVTRQMLVVCPPFVVLFICLSYYAVRTILKKREVRYLMKRSILVVTVVFYVSYISLTRAAVTMLYCIDVFDGTRLADREDHNLYWGLDTDVKCFDGVHLRLVFVAIPLLLLSFLFPVVLAANLLLAKRRRKLNSEWIAETVGLFYRGFEKDFVYWDSMILLRKAILVPIVVNAYHLGGSLQGTLSALLLSFFLFLQMRFSPFNREFTHLNDLESASLLISIFTFLTGIILNDSYMHSYPVEVLLVIAVLVCNIGFALLLLVLLIRLKLEEIRFSLLSQEIDCESASIFSVALIFVVLHYENAVKTISSFFQQAPDEPPGNAGLPSEMGLEMQDRI